MPGMSICEKLVDMVCPTRTPNITVTLLKPSPLCVAVIAFCPSLRRCVSETRDGITRDWKFTRDNIRKSQSCLLSR